MGGRFRSGVVRGSVFLGACGLVASCAIKVNVPVNRFDSPETIGKQWRVKLDAAGGGSNNVVVTPDATQLGPNTASPLFERGTFLRFGGGLGILDNLDLELRNFSTLQAKYQFLGDGRLNAEAGNVALALTLAGGFDQESDNGSALVVNSNSYSMHKNEYFVDSGLVAGYRVAKWFLIYTGPFARQTWYTGDYAVGSSPSQLGPSTAFSGAVTSYGANVGLEFGVPLFQARVEYAYGQVKSGALNTGQGYLGGEIAFNFGKH